jgi:hypothetical protein
MDNTLINMNYNDRQMFELTFDGLVCSAKAVKIYDGDTLTLIWYSLAQKDYIKMSCRMANYNATEMTKVSDEEKRKAIEMRDYLTSLVATCDNEDIKTNNKKIVKVRFFKNEPAYKRPLICLYDTNETDLTFENSINQKIMDKFNLPVYNPSEIDFTTTPSLIMD